MRGSRQLLVWEPGVWGPPRGRPLHLQRLRLERVATPADFAPQMSRYLLRNIDVYRPRKSREKCLDTWVKANPSWAERRAARGRSPCSETYASIRWSCRRNCGRSRCGDGDQKPVVEEALHALGVRARWPRGVRRRAEASMCLVALAGARAAGRFVALCFGEWRRLEHFCSLGGFHSNGYMCHRLRSRREG